MSWLLWLVLLEQWQACIFFQFCLGSSIFLLMEITVDSSLVLESSLSDLIATDCHHLPHILPPKSKVIIRINRVLQSKWRKPAATDLDFYWYLYSRGWKTFLVKSLIVKYLGLESHIISRTATSLCHCGTRAITDNVNKWVGSRPNNYLFRNAACLVRFGPELLSGRWLVPITSSEKEKKTNTDSAATYGWQSLSSFTDCFVSSPW